jgi:hypothetical protein
MTKLTPALAQSRLLALPEHQCGKMIQFAQRRALAAETLVDVSAKPLWTRDVISQSHPFLFTLAAIMAALGIFFGLWFALSTYRAPRPSYPYYDTQKPVPPRSEPTPLEGNHGR